MRKEKQLLLDDIRDRIQGSKSVMLMSYRKLDANKTANFRTEIAKAGGSVYVVKKRVLVKAAETVGMSLQMDQLKGHIGVILSQKDAVETTKAFFKFSKESAEETFEVIGGQFEGQLCSAMDFEKIAKLPGLEQMRSELLATFESPLSHTLSVLEAILTCLPYCLENKATSE